MPVDRLTPDLPPFTCVGVEYFEPIDVKGVSWQIGMVRFSLVSPSGNGTLSGFRMCECIQTFHFLERPNKTTKLSSDNRTNLISAEDLKEWNVDLIKSSLFQKGVKSMLNPRLIIIE